MTSLRIFLTGLLAVSFLTTVAAATNCTEGEWSCLSMDECIPQESVCNGVPDCTDAADEAVQLCSSPEYVNKTIATNCTEGEWPCLSMDECIPQESVCNGVPDCTDGTDEAVQLCSLPEYVKDTAATNCTEGEWPCLSMYQCIHQTEVCDGEAHCRDGTDETFHLCSSPDYPCPEFSFHCPYGGCVPKDVLCDKTFDCADHSDELLPTCEGVNSTLEIHNCTSSEFACLSGGQCIPLHQVCDGEAHCADTSDETVTQCALFSCPDFGFKCSYGGCVDGDAACDGKFDCADESDEFAPECNFTGLPPLPIRNDASKSVGCLLPAHPDNGRYTTFNSCDKDDLHPRCQGVKGTKVDGGFILDYECDVGYSLRGVIGPNGTVSQTCKSGKWTPEVTPSCSDECEPLVSKKMDLLCYNEKYKVVPKCEGPMKNNYTAHFRCKHATHFQQKDVDYKMYSCYHGSWDRPFDDSICRLKCGTWDSRVPEPVVWKGETVSGNNFPWHATIYQNDDGNWVAICGGSLISRDMVISAAHCFKYGSSDFAGLRDRDIKLMKVAFGKSYYNLSHAENDQQTIEIEKVISHDGYKGASDNYGKDIAVVFLSERVNFTNRVLPVCLDFHDSDKHLQLVYEGAFGLIPGFGTTENNTHSDKLLVAKMKFVPRDTCEATTESFNYVTDDKICAGEQGKGQNVCHGDSGGGFVFKDPQRHRYHLEGIVSLGDENCKGDDYAFFTNVTFHYTWLGSYYNYVED